MTPDDVEHLAAEIWAARLEHRTLDAATTVERLGGPVTMADAYRVQSRIVERRLDRGERIVGWKLGYTSAAMREQMGVDEPNYGPLTDAMLRADGATLGDTVTQPRVEPEIAVELARALRPPVTLQSVAAAIGSVRSCLEVVDSVWTDYRFRIEHNTADGSSAAHVVLGPPLRHDDLAAIPVRLLRNGVEVAEALGSAASGHPLAGVVWLAEQLAAGGRGLDAGEVIITGGLTAAVPLDPGDVVEAVFDDGVSVTVRRQPDRQR